MDSAAAAGDERAALLRVPAWKTLAPVASACVDPRDRAAGLGRAGIALRRHHDGERGPGREGRRRLACQLALRQSPASAGAGRPVKRIISTGHSGSPKRALYSISLGPVGRQHQPGIEHARIGCAHPGQRRDRRRTISVDRPGFQRRREHRRGAVGAHAAGVRAGIAVAHALVVPRRAERDKLSRRR